MSTRARQLIRSPITPLVAGVRFWLTHGARIRRARLLCQLADGIRLRQLREWESRSIRLYRRAALGLSGLASTENGAMTKWARAANRMLKRAQRPYRDFVAGLAVLAGEVAVAVCLFVLIGCALSLDLRRRLFPEDLARGKPWIVRDADSGILFRGDDLSTKDTHFFHTNDVDNPSLEIDLGAAHLIRSIRIDNRADCCKERALPLNVEVLDGTTWRLIAQRRSFFSTWSYDVEPVRARMVRIRRPGKNFFHLKRISIYGQ
jgi:hypothetical protein